MRPWLALSLILLTTAAEAAAPPVRLEEPLPPFALRRLGTTRFRWGTCDSLRESSDGRLAAVENRDAIRVRRCGSVEA